MLIPDNSFQLAIFSPRSHYNQRIAAGWEESKIKEELLQLVVVIKTFEYVILTGSTPLYYDLVKDLENDFVVQRATLDGKRYDFLTKQRRYGGLIGNLYCSDLFGFKHFVAHEERKKTTSFAFAVISPNSDVKIGEFEEIMVPYLSTQDEVAFAEENEFVKVCNETLQTQTRGFQIVTGIRLATDYITISHNVEFYAALQKVTVTAENHLFRCQERSYDVDTRTFKDNEKSSRLRIMSPPPPTMLEDGDVSDDDDDDSQTGSSFGRIVGACTIV